MSKEDLKKEFYEELEFFLKIVRRDLKNGLSADVIEDGFIRTTASFYGTRLNTDKYATKKCVFLATYASSIIAGNVYEVYTAIDNLFNEIENENKISGVNH